MVIITGFVAVVDGLAFTITWTICPGSLTAMTIEEAQIYSVLITSALASAMAPTMLTMAPTTPPMSPITLTTRRLLPHCQGR